MKVKRTLRTRQQVEMSIAVAILLLLGGGAVYLSYYGPISGAALLVGKQYAPGDVNGDGVINDSDVQLTVNIAAGVSKVPRRQWLAADLNNDGKVTVQDAVLIARKSQQKGDFNNDGVFSRLDVIALQQLLQNHTQPTAYQLAVGDYTKDGTLTGADLIAMGTDLRHSEKAGDIDGDGAVTVKDIQLAASVLVGTVPTADTIASFSPDAAVNYLLTDYNNDGKIDVTDLVSIVQAAKDQGDVTLDGKLTIDDLKILMQYIVHSATPSQVQQVLADVNGDGAVNILDVTALLKQTPTLMGDVNEDGVVTAADGTLVENSIVKLATLDDAQKVLADMNGDGTITVQDVTLILQKAQASQ